MARKTKEDAEKTYHALLDAAVQLFIRQGVARTTLNAIASEAGMTRGAIYWHFDNKEAVIRALWERNAERLHAGYRQLFEQIDAERPAQTFRAAVRDMIRVVAAEPEVGQVLRILVHNVEFTDQQTDLQQFLNAKKSALLHSVIQAFETLQRHAALRVQAPAELLAHALLAYLHGLLVAYLSPHRERPNLLRDGDRLVDLFLDGVLR